MEVPVQESGRSVTRDRVCIVAPYQLLVVGVLACLAGCEGSKTARVTLGDPADQFANLSAERIEHLDGKVREFCADCHVFPAPSSYPKGNWSEEVSRGYEFYAKSGRTDLTPPSKHVVVEYFQTLAPMKLELPSPLYDLDGPVQFRRSPIRYAGSQRKRPGVSHLFNSEQGLLICDVTSDRIGKVSVEEGQVTYDEILSSAAPAHVTWFAPLPDESPGLLVAELGTFTPDDHDKGAVVFFSHESLQEEDPEGIKLLEGVGRVADVSTGDFDGDGLTDVVVAEFGWHETGGMHVLWNKSNATENLRFETQRIDSRHGASHVHVQDLDQDGDSDFIVLHSQEYESVSAYLNMGDGQFERQQVWNANVPDYGLSSMDLADIDRDGDLDVVLSNGDSMDSFLLKPHHGVQWLENRSQGESLEYVHHPVAQLPAAYGATAGDIDGDGDIDLIGCTMLWESQDLNTLVWYEQKDDGTFESHPLDLSSSQHAAVELGDFDGDGDLDIAVGEFDRYIQLDFCGEIWWNEGPAPNLAENISE